MTTGHSKALMTLPNRMLLVNLGDDIQTFARIGSLSGESTYVNTSGLPSSVVDTLQLRTTSKGLATKPALMKKTYNVRREIGTLNSTTGEVSTVVVNLTIQTPGAGLGESTLLEAFHDVMSVAQAFGDITDSSGASGGGISDAFGIAVKFQEI